MKRRNGKKKRTLRMAFWAVMAMLLTETQVFAAADPGAVNTAVTADPGAAAAADPGAAADMPADTGTAVDLTGVYPISTNGVAGWPAGPEISSDTGVLMEAETGMLVYNKGGDELRYPASITKLMTLLLAVENSSLTDTVTFTETGVRDVTPDSGNIGMQLGETMTMEDCLYAMIIYSANEVSAQIAEFVGGTEQNFIDMMNDRAAQIGCTNTHFTNASGLPDPDQYTTARDMALIFREGIKNPLYRQILGTPTYEIPPTNLNGQSRRLHTHHPLFAEESALHYEGCFGGKSGMTNDAGHTLVTGVERDGVTYIAVVLRAADLSKACVDSHALFDYGYQNFSKTAYRNGNIVLPNGADAGTVTVQTFAEEGREDYFFSNYHVGGGTVMQPQSAEPSVTEPAEETVPASAEVVEETGDAEQEPLYQGEDGAGPAEDLSDPRDTDPEEGGEESVLQEEGEKGISRLAQILFGVMAGMILLLILLLAVLMRKKKNTRRR